MFQSPKSEDRKAKAQSTLWHYFKVLADRSGVQLDSDCQAEINGIVEHIEDMIEAMVLEAIEKHKQSS